MGAPPPPISPWSPHPRLNKGIRFVLPPAANDDSVTLCALRPPPTLCAVPLAGCDCASGIRPFITYESDGRVHDGTLRRAAAVNSRVDSWVTSERRACEITDWLRRSTTATAPLRRHEHKRMSNSRLLYYVAERRLHSCVDRKGCKLYTAMPRLIRTAAKNPRSDTQSRTL